MAWCGPPLQINHRQIRLSNLPHPPLTPVKSSNLAAAGHDGEALYVQFRSGKTYRLAGADASHLNALIGAESPGRYFHRNLKGKHKAEVVLTP